MKKPVHQMTMEQAFTRAGAPPWRQEREPRREGDWPAQSVRGTDEQVNEQDEIEAAREWLRHVETGRIG